MINQLNNGLTAEKPGDYTNFHHPALSKEALYKINSKVTNCVARALVALAITLSGAVAGTAYHIGKAFLPKEEGSTQLRLAITCLLRGIVAPFIAVNFAAHPKEYGYKEITWKDRDDLIHNNHELSDSKFQYTFTHIAPGSKEYKNDGNQVQLRANPEAFYFKTYKLSGEALNKHNSDKENALPAIRKQEQEMKAQRELRDIEETFRAYGG